MKRINLILLFLLFVIILSIISYNKYEKLSMKGSYNNSNNNNGNNENNNNENNSNNYSNMSNNNEYNNNENFTISFPNNGYHGSNFPYPNTTSYLPINYNQSPYNYPNVKLPPAVIGCGGRRGACTGGSEIAIPNILPQVNISETNISPVNLTMRGFDDGVQQVGTIQKVFGDENFVYPLFGRRRYRNDNKWDYFVKFGKYGVILPIHPLRNYEELNTNDSVYIQGQKDKYRVTIYDDDIPQYLPYS